jgi:tetratricopeptide (TPR) repeat protein
MNDESSSPPNSAPRFSDNTRFRELYELWRALSEMVHRGRHSPYPSSTNPLLREQVNAEPRSLLAPMLLQWMGDSLQLEGRFTEAIEAYQEIPAAYPDRNFGGMPWAALALDQVAICHEFLGNTRAAEDVLRHLAEHHSNVISPAWLQYHIGRLAEQDERDEEAISAYRRTSELPDIPRQTQVNIKDLARRDAERLTQSREWIRSRPELLAREVLSALTERDVQVLERLASPTHFSLGFAGSERKFVDRRAVLTHLFADLERSTVRAKPSVLRGAGSKRYIDTQGWQGDLFKEEVIFILTEARDGFEWSGIGVTRIWKEPPDIPDDPEEVPPDGDTPEDPSDRPNQPMVTPADLKMKAPWAKGEHFRAGGIIPFTAQLAAIAAALAGTGIFFPYLYGLALVALSASSPCGLGPGGLYYGQPTTHQGRDNFAIDFSRFLQGVPFWLDARGKAVLAVADGIVTFRRANFATGDPTLDNQVVIGHMTEAEIFLAFLIELLTGKRVLPKYSSEYLHLDGPFMIPVSVGMFVRQGARLGVVDDTGLSVADHLHFSLHDRDLPFLTDSVRPTPMDGQTLNDGDDGRCMFSTNVPIP